MIDDDFADRWASKMLSEIGIAYGDFKGTPEGLRVREAMRSAMLIAIVRHAPADNRIPIGATNV